MIPSSVHARIEPRVVDLLRQTTDGVPDRNLLAAAVAQALTEARVLLPRAEVLRLERQLDDRLFGLGPLGPLLRDGAVTEVMVNGLRGVWVERNGRLQRTEVRFESEEELLILIERLVAPVGRRIDHSSPLVDARLPDGSRVHAAIPPVSLTGPSLTIRRFSEAPFRPEDLVRLGSASEALVADLLDLVRRRRSVLVSGGTSSGKTSTLNALGHAIGVDERVVTIEDAAELRLPQPNLVALETRPPNVEGTGEITVRTLLRNALRMRPDRIIVGEVRGGEALDMLQAMNTGHRGSLTTAHANGPDHALSRVETMALMGGVDLPLSAIREQIRHGIDAVVHQERDSNGVRRIVSVHEMTGDRRQTMRERWRLAGNEWLRS
jgi:pilus assembly protein CpaF